MNDNIKDLLISTNLEDISLGLEMCKRLDVPIMEIETIYHEYTNPDKYYGELWHDVIETYFTHLDGYSIKEHERFVKEHIENKYFKSWKH